MPLIWFVLLWLLWSSSDLPLSAGTTTARSDTSSSALGNSPPNWDSVLESLSATLSKPAPGIDPLVYFIDPIGPDLGLRDAAAILGTKKLPAALADELLVSDLATTARQLVRDMVAWSLARAALAVSERQGAAYRNGRYKQIAEQSAWLNTTSNNIIPMVGSTAETARALEPVETTDSYPLDESSYQAYARHLDVKYPSMPAGPNSWLEVLESQGPAGWTSRLADSPADTPLSNTERSAFAVHYLATRLQPLLRQRLEMQARQLALSASEAVSLHWFILHQWKDTVRERRGRTRLCGSWQWTIHNHQNHGEQKLLVIFPPVGTAQNNDGPAEIVVLGDVVYLRWEASGKIQEDSLLLSKEGQRLEGTFVNNAGGWGSITGKRTAPCAKR